MSKPATVFALLFNASACCMVGFERPSAALWLACLAAVCTVWAIATAKPIKFNSERY